MVFMLDTCRQVESLARVDVKGLGNLGKNQKKGENTVCAQRMLK